MIDSLSRRYDRIFGLLANKQRRRALHHLMEVSDCHRDDLVDQLVEWEAAPTPSQPPNRETVVCTLTHVHLPRLEEAGIVDYDDETVQYHGDPELEEHLELTRDADLPS